MRRLAGIISFMTAAWACGPSSSGVPLPAAGTSTSTSAGGGAPVELPRSLGKWSVSETNDYWGLCVVDHWFFTQNELRYKCRCEGELHADAGSFERFKESRAAEVPASPSAGEKESFAQCLTAALSEHSDHEDAASAVDNWNRRQLEYEAETCKDEVIAAHEDVKPAEARAYCLCQKRAIAGKLGFLDYTLSRNGAKDAASEAATACKGLRKW